MPDVQQPNPSRFDFDKLFAIPHGADLPTDGVPAIDPPDRYTVGTPKGIKTPGNIDLFARPRVQNADGSISTVRSMSFEEDGQEILVPTVSDDGRILSEQEAIDAYHKTGRNLGTFTSPEDATAYAQQLHAQQEGLYIPNDRTDAALKSRSESYQKADDLNWLVEGTNEPAVTEGGPAIPVSGGFTADKPKGQPLRIGPAELPGLVGAAAMDIGGGAVEAPRQAVGGMRDAVQSIIDFGDVLDSTTIPGTNIPLSLGGVTFTDKQGNFSPDYHGPSEWRALQNAGDVHEPSLPTVGAPETATGNVIRGVSQFIRVR